MSWNAMRYHREPRRFRFERYPTHGRRTNRHHVPPKSEGGTYVIEADTIQHRAYHILFGNAASIDECVQVLKRNWWPIGSSYLAEIPSVDLTRPA